MVYRAKAGVSQTGTILDRIVAHKRQEIETRNRVRPLSALYALVAQVPPARAFADNLGASGISLIAEVKRASPSQGALISDLDPPTLARAYASGGAAAISVLTDKRFFRGSLFDLQEVRDTVSLPVLRKDFIIEPYQIYEARAAGADAILLIMSILTDEAYRRLLALSQELGMAALVEVHNRAELDRALTPGPRIVGINNRNLHTFEVDLETTCALRPHVPPGVLLVAESGIQSAADVTRLADAGVDAILVGTALVTARDPGSMVQRMVEAGRPRARAVEERGP
jgi:indole-3-glycerol phosphate synthase